MQGRDRPFSMCQTSLYTDLYQRNMVLNAGSTNSHFKSTKSSGNAVKDHVTNSEKGQPEQVTQSEAGARSL